jgi:hypothetical protein
MPAPKPSTSAAPMTKAVMRLLLKKLSPPGCA